MSAKDLAKELATGLGSGSTTAVMELKPKKQPVAATTDKKKEKTMRTPKAKKPAPTTPAAEVQTIKVETPAAEAAKVEEATPGPKAVPAIVKTETPTAKPAAKPTLSLAERFSKAAGNKIAKVVGDLNELEQFLKTPEAVNMFMDTMKAAEDLAIQVQTHLHEEQVVEEWRKLNFEEIEEKLRFWYVDEGNQAAKDLLEPLEMLKANSAGIIQVLWPIWTEVVRPANDVAGFKNLSTLVHNMEGAGRVARRYHHDEQAVRKHANLDAVVLKSGTGYMSYMPTTTAAKIGWQYVKNAEKRANEVHNRFR